MVRATALIGLVMLLAACGSSEKRAGGVQICPPLANAATTPRLSPAVEARATAYLTDVTMNATDCSDRVVFAFREGATPGPGYNVSYEPADSAKTEDGSGNRIEIDGSAFLVVRLTPAMTAEIVGEKVKPTYTGPRRIAGEGTHLVHEVVKTGDFEAMVTWVIGLPLERPFTATASESELVIEFG